MRSVFSCFVLMLLVASLRASESGVGPEPSLTPVIIRWPGDMFGVADKDRSKLVLEMAESLDHLSQEERHQFFKQFAENLGLFTLPERTIIIDALTRNAPSKYRQYVKQYFRGPKLKEADD